MSIDALTTTLLDLAAELKGTVEPLMVGGGFGLYLKQQHLERARTETLIPGDLWPPARSTQDIDLLLSAEIVASPDQMRAIREALSGLGYAAVVKHMQFAKSGPGGQVKIDLLTGPIPEDLSSHVKIKETRVRPRTERGLHAYETKEAIAVDQGAIDVPVTGQRCDGRKASMTIQIPGPFTMLLMKLLAFRDRERLLRALRETGDVTAGQQELLAKHHALDVYRIVAMLTREDFEQVQRLVHENENESEAVVQDAVGVVESYFGAADDAGPVRIQSYVRENYPGGLRLDMEEFLAALGDLFKPGD